MYTARINSDIIRYALLGTDARNGRGSFSTDHYREGFPRYGAPYHGHLPRPWRALLDERFRAGAIRQVIYSYSTPIAWLDSQYGWISPVVSYSTTTSTKHQTHLWRLPALRNIVAPWDATLADLYRVLDGVMVFTTNARGDVTGITRGPNYVEGE